MHVLCCLLCLSCSCSVNPSVSAAPSLVSDSSIVKTALRLLALSATAPSSRLLRGPGLVQRQRRQSGTPRSRGTAEETHASPSPGETSDATSSPGPPCQAAGTPGNSREVHLNPAWCVQRPRTPGPPSACTHTSPSPIGSIISSEPQQEHIHQHPARTHRRTPQTPHHRRPS